MTDTARAHHGDHAEHLRRLDGAAIVKDPVCGMDVDPAVSKHRAEYAGETFHFCSAGCRTKFQTDPARYVADGGGPTAAAAPVGAI